MPSRCSSIREPICPGVGNQRVCQFLGLSSNIALVQGMPVIDDAAQGLKQLPQFILEVPSVLTVLRAPERAFIGN